MTGRSATLVVMVIGIVLLTFTMGAKPMPRFVWNASESVPLGLYNVAPADNLAVTNLVVAMPPEPLATFLANRGYLPLGVPLIKASLLFLASQCAGASSPSASMESRWVRRSRTIGVAAHCRSGRVVE